MKKLIIVACVVYGLQMVAGTYASDTAESVVTSAMSDRIAKIEELTK